MPVNWEQLHIVMKETQRGLDAHARSTRAAQASVLTCVQKYVREPDLGPRIDSLVAVVDPDLRCARPTAVRWDSGYSAASTAGAYTILAADGSQVTPDRHDEVQFGIVNIGTVTMRRGSGQAPSVATDTTLLYGDRLFTGLGTILSEGDIALMRDQGERASLLHLARGAAAPCVALTDGPLELWGSKDISDPRAFENALHEYLTSLSDMSRLNCTVAGYVDKPGADLLIRLFEVLEADTTDRQSLRLYRPFRGATDRWLFGSILSPGQRSAVFGLQSSSRSRYGDELAIDFFYLNVGTDGHPAIARIEVPHWVAGRPPLVQDLHAALLEQCALLGARPYPYILHRAHETARVSLQEKEEIKLRLLLDLREASLEIEEMSGKAAAKLSSDLKGSP